MPECLFFLLLPYTFRKRVFSNRNKAMEECRRVEMWWAQAVTREMPIQYCERHFLKKGGQTPEQFAQRSCGSSIPGDTQNSASSNTDHNLTSKLVLLSAGDWSRWLPDVSSYLNYSSSDLCLPEAKKPLTLYIMNVGILTFTKWKVSLPRSPTGQ